MPCNELCGSKPCSVKQRQGLDACTLNESNPKQGFTFTFTIYIYYFALVFI